MKVLHVLDHSAPLQSGYAFRTLAILREQAKLGWQTFQLTSPKHGHAEAPVEEAAGLRFYRTAAGTDWSDRLPVAGEIRLMQRLASRLREVVDLVRPDILHAHSPVLDAYPALAVGRRFGLPVVYEIRSLWEDSAVEKGASRRNSPKYRATRFAETRALRRCDHVVVISAGLRDEVIARGIAPDRVTVVPNGVDLDRFPVIGEPDAALAARLGLAGSRVVGYAGSLHPYEGLDLLIEAFGHVVRRQPDVRLLLVGAGAAEPALRARAGGAGLLDRIVFAGQVPHDAVPSYLSLMTVLVYPRRRSRLTDIVTPLKPLEAMAQGIAVVASDIGGHRELIDNGRTGHLVLPEDPGALADTLAEVLGSESKRSSTIVAARDYVSTARTWARSVEGYRQAYLAAGVPAELLSA